MAKPKTLGKYSLIRRVGGGGMAEVWKARFHGPEGFEKTVAIKKILPHLAERNSFVDMFVAEAKLVARLTHPNIVQLVDFARVEEEGQGSGYFIAMEYVAGQNLRELQWRAQQAGVKIPLEVALYVTIEAAKALGHAHAEGLAATGRMSAVVHQDISPANVLISYSGDVKVADFGIANVVRKLVPEEEAELAGKIGYMSPEQARAEQLDPRSDIFSLGVVLFEVCAGERLFEGEPAAILPRLARFELPEERIENIPALVQDILRTAMAPDRDARYPDAQELEADLASILDRGSHIAARKALASLMQQLFSAEQEMEMKEEYGDEAATTGQMTKPREEFFEERRSPDDPTRATVVSSELFPSGITAESESMEMPIAGMEAAAQEDPGPPESSEAPTRLFDRPTQPPESDKPTPLGDRPTEPREAIGSGGVESASAPFELDRGTAPFERAPSDEPSLPGANDPTIVGPRPVQVGLGQPAQIGRNDPAFVRGRGAAVEHARPTSPDDITGFVDFPEQKKKKRRGLRLFLLFVLLIIAGMFLYVRQDLLPMEQIRTAAARLGVDLGTAPTETPTTISMADSPLPEVTEMPTQTAVPTAKPTRTPHAARTPRVVPTKRATPRARTPTPRPATPTPTPVVVQTPPPTPTPAPVRFGALTVNARPWAEVWVDGKRVGSEGVTNYRLKAGQHRVEFVYPVKKFRAQRTIVITADKETRVFVDAISGRISIR